MRSDLESTIGGRYVAGEVIGRGGMGEVRAGRDLRLDRDVAIKFLSEEMAERPTTRERFEAEARSAARLSHPNVVHVYDTGEHEGQPFLVMERLPGRTLADEMEAGPLDPERVRRVGLDILAALDAAHAAGVVHRDIKPGNVLLCPDGSVKTADFGIAKTLEGVDLTTTGTLLGTPAYLSPEQVVGDPATPASDIYSVGVVLYEALAGRKPFMGTGPIAVAHAVQHDEPVPLAELRPDAPPDLVAAITMAMDKDPLRRFATAQGMAAALSPPGDGLSGTVELSGTQQLRTTPTHDDRAVRRPGTGLAALADGARRNAVILAAVFAVILVAALLLAWSKDPAPEPATSSPTTVAVTPGSVPADLDRALDNLEEAVRP